ncbi:hypothetical protein Tco_0534867 [Tanacetum coccineum]
MEAIMLMGLKLESPGLLDLARGTCPGLLDDVCAGSKHAAAASPTAQSPDYVPESNPEANPDEDDDEDPE